MVVTRVDPLVASSTSACWAATRSRTPCGSSPAAEGNRRRQAASRRSRGRTTGSGENDNGAGNGIMKVREVVRILREDGRRGSISRQPPSLSTSDQAWHRNSSGQHERRSSSEDIKQHLSTSGIAAGGAQLRFLVIIEKGPNNLSAYVPDLPGCVSTGRDREEVMQHPRGR